MKPSAKVIKFPAKKRQRPADRNKPMTQEQRDIGREAIAKLRKMLEEDRS